MGAESMPTTTMTTTTAATATATAATSHPHEPCKRRRGSSFFGLDGSNPNPNPNPGHTQPTTTSSANNNAHNNRGQDSHDYSWSIKKFLSRHTGGVCTEYYGVHSLLFIYLPTYLPTYLLATCYSLNMIPDWDWVYYGLLRSAECHTHLTISIPCLLTYGVPTGIWPADPSIHPCHLNQTGQVSSFLGEGGGGSGSGTGAVDIVGFRRTFHPSHSFARRNFYWTICNSYQYSWRWFGFDPIPGVLGGTLGSNGLE
ncbi:hypothetical protein BO70DRAFT_351999 [Aspergillus heteromorphus CBS 117.55]|uniref:Uncharacterized protein n=1 Tax=Aspergillus heteromorphus CBS 117.55 TaxID=1448321 RepID=A0A317WIH9_9EURO|nr:uncharacterized protein BO70DRAFT_351999 [Aspergillus heteromorphus CBS 117.55]PWY84868.1 hypothetical protein BO70DRAFT_351999 [Aspergillus heteromorphus CBS 117.55]